MQATIDRRLAVAARLCMIAALVTACGAPPIEAPALSQGEAQTPSEYLADALDWIEEHAVTRDQVDWASVRQQALGVASHPQTTAETYPALRLVLQQLGPGPFLMEPGAFLGPPKDGLGVTMLFPQGTVVFVEPGSAAERAGVRTGDMVETINGARPAARSDAPWLAQYDNAPVFRLELQRASQGPPVSLTVQATRTHYDGTRLGRRLDALRPGAGAAGYLELPYDWGSRLYPTRAQQVMRDVDRPAVCGWIIDLRRNIGGDIWTYLAAVGPILGEGDVGGFAYRTGQREWWTYRDGKVFWNGRPRDESYVKGPIYSPQRPMLPVALLTSRATTAAGELVRVAFQGRLKLRSFGEPTGGAPVLLYHTPLSDDAHLFVAGAFAFDRTGRVYDGRIPPDDEVEVDWTVFGTDRDPVLRAAREWLDDQPECAR
jgi:carboxyl-terminal processing protease